MPGGIVNYQATTWRCPGAPADQEWTVGVEVHQKPRLGHARAQDPLQSRRGNRLARDRIMSEATVTERTPALGARSILLTATGAIFLRANQ
jgi:hypothetical protein